MIKEALELIGDNIKTLLKPIALILVILAILSTVFLRYAADKLFDDAAYITNNTCRASYGIAVIDDANKFLVSFSTSHDAKYSFSGVEKERAEYIHTCVEDLTTHKVKNKKFLIEKVNIPFSHTIPKELYKKTFVNINSTKQMFNFPIFDENGISAIHNIKFNDLALSGLKFSILTDKDYMLVNFNEELAKPTAIKRENGYTFTWRTIHNNGKIKTNEVFVDDFELASNERVMNLKLSIYGTYMAVGTRGKNSTILELKHAYIIDLAEKEEVEQFCCTEGGWITLAEGVRGSHLAVRKERDGENMYHIYKFKL